MQTKEELNRRISHFVDVETKGVLLATSLTLAMGHCHEVHCYFLNILRHSTPLHFIVTKTLLFFSIAL